MPATEPRPRFSLFAKLVAIMLAMATSLMVLVGAFFMHIVGPTLNDAMNVVVREYAREAAKGGLDYPTALRLQKRANIDVRYEGPGGGWTTSPRLPSIAEGRRLQGQRRWVWAGYVVEPAPGWRGTFVEPAGDGGNYLFAWSVGRNLRLAHDALVVVLLLLLAGVVLTTHAVLKRLLLPLRTLGEGVGRLSAGELDVTLPVRSRDEFATLTTAFNLMVARVGTMIRARDQLLVDVSHELRSPLTRMKVALELLPEADKRRRMAADVAEMEAMVTELLELERLREGRGIHAERRDLLPILRRVVQGFEGRSPGVKLRGGPPSLDAEIDEEKLQSVLRNLLDNALKYSLPDSRPVEIAASVEGDTVLVRVTDDGRGIPPEDLGSVFEPFFRVDRSRSKLTGGYGLGLSICKRIMEAHGGTIAVQNNPGRGATFVLTFPRHS